MIFHKPLRALLLAFVFLTSLGAAPESGLAPPVVVVYPLTSTGQNGAQTGSNVSVVLANKLAELGGLSVEPYTPGTARAQFLEAALKEGADYYVTGFMTPVGAEVSMVVQVVSTSSGSVVYSATTMARTYADAANQADTLRDAILRHATRGLPTLNAPAPPSGSPVPNPSDAGGVNLTKTFGRKRRRPPAAQPSAAPVAAAAPSPSGPPRTSHPAAVAAAALDGRRLVVLVGGPADAADRAYAATALAAALRHGGAQSGLLAVTPDEAAAHVADLCKANAGTRTLYAGTLAIEAGVKNAKSAVIDIAAYDCNGAAVVRRHVVSRARRRNGATRAAIDRAASDAIDALQKPAVAGYGGVSPRVSPRVSLRAGS